MEIWIRSQDKTKLVKVNELYMSIPADFGRGTFGIYSSNSNYYDRSKPLLLAEYNSKERALEVLDEIQELDTNKKNIIVSHHFDKITKITYEMPKE